MCSPRADNNDTRIDEEDAQVCMRYLPGAPDSSRVPKGSGTTSSEAPESTSRMADGLSAEIQEQQTLKMDY